MTVPPAATIPGERSRARRVGRAESGAPIGSSRRTGYLFVGLYVVLLALFGIAPTVYAIYLSLTKVGGGFAWGANFSRAYDDFRFLPAFEHVGEYLAIWLIAEATLILVLALMLHSLARRTSAAFRFLFYMPGALAGAASVLVWLFMLDPTLSPWHFLLSALGFSQIDLVMLPSHLPFIFAIMAFWTGAGGWIVVMYGALNNIPDELLEAAKLDGANALQSAVRIKLPLIKKWVVYMLILSFAGGTQLFVEPQLVGQATAGLVSNTWSPNQLAYYIAFINDNFNEAAAISVTLLVLGLVGATLLVWRTKLFEIS
jgi:multiple sugar transport system permease protein